MQSNYYSKNLNSQKLYDVYQTRYPRVKTYLAEEIAFVKARLQGIEDILELGAGYGRIMKELAPHCKSITGIDISEDNVAFGGDYLQDTPNSKLIVMDAHKISPKVFEAPFDVVLCMQNALSSMKVEPFSYTEKIMSLLAANGRVFISTYSAKFWQHRLEWFLEQAEKGLLGEIDLEKSKDGVIVGKDGFCSVTHSRSELDEIGKSTGCPYEIQEVDESSVFLVITKK
ncbi:MAG: class I SAM-dependent methyltransferase [Defluviitaleaceae bacterium]|nr:class I SAM-dependent methyltransferase [Defluviitaleaceae bacterium]